MALFSCDGDGFVDGYAWGGFVTSTCMSTQASK
jgi:hypothetical protein